MAKAKLAALAAHALCELIPGGLTEDEHQAMVEDVKKNGVLEPITLFEGKILDGRARYRAAMAAGIECPTEELNKKCKVAALDFLMSKNLQRRTLTGMQKALAAAELYRRNFVDNVAGISQDSLVKRFGLSKQTLSLCIKALDSKNAMLLARMRRGEVTRTELEEEFYDRTAANTATPTGSAEVEAGGDIFGEAPVPGAPGKAIKFPEKAHNALPEVGKRNTHPERRATETPASVALSHFKGLSESDRTAFVAMAWPWLEAPVAAHIATLKAMGTSADATAAKPAKKGGKAGRAEREALAAEAATK